MKRIVLLLAGLTLLPGLASAQDKEVAKAEKSAKKEAETNLKKAQSAYKMSIPNMQYDRKETNFETLATSVPFIEAAMASEHTNGLADTWKTAADIYVEYYKKMDNEVKADPDNDQLKEDYIVLCSKLADYCMKYDSIIALDTKMKPEVRDIEHKRYQAVATNPVSQLLQASQSYSNSDDQAELKKGVRYSEQFLNIIENSHIMSDFSNPGVDLNEWKTYARAFRAQSYLNIEGTPEDKIESAYTTLLDTRYKGIAYQSLVNYFKERDSLKQNKYLKEAITALEGDSDMVEVRENFALVLIQNQFKAHDKEGFAATAAIIKAEMAENSNAANTWLMEGQWAYDEKRYDEARDIFLDGYEKFPSEINCLLMAARSIWMKAQERGSKKEDMLEAIKLFERLENDVPESPDMWGEPLYVLYNNTQQTAKSAKYKKYYKGSR